MTRPLRKKTKIVLTCFVFSIASYVVFLLVTNYLSQKKMIDSFDKQLHYAFEKQALVLNHFFTDRERDLRVFANSRTLSTYFKNKALGMSKEYGLATNLIEIDKWLENYWKDSNSAEPIYEWLVLLDQAGKVISSVHKEGHPAATDTLQKISAETGDKFSIRMETVPQDGMIVVSLPYYFKNTLKGYVAGGISIEKFYKRTITFKAVYEFSSTYLYCAKHNFLYPEKNRGLTSLLHKHIDYSPAVPNGLPTGQIHPPGSNKQLIYFRINNTRLYLVTEIERDNYLFGLSPRNTILTLVFFPLFIFGVMGLLMRSEIQKSILSIKYAEAQEKALFTEKHNTQLLAEAASRIEAEKKLRQSEERYRSLIENVPDIIFSIDNTLRISDIHLSNSLSLGFGESHLIGEMIAQFIHTDDQPVVLETLESDYKENRQFRHGVRFRLASMDGTTHWVEANVSYQYDEKGHFKNADGVLRDVTEQKILEQQLIQTERLAAAGQLAASIAHEINSPLAGISALLGILKKKYQKSEDTLPKLVLIQQAFDNISEIVKKLLDMNRPGTNKVQHSHINSIINSTVDVTRSYLKKNKIEIQLDFGDSIPEFDCHPQELGQVVLNLINNTVDAISDSGGRGGKAAADGGEITISTRCINDQLQIDYYDSGPGIADADMEQIFDPFFTKKAKKGMGLGLALCNEIISRHNGILKAVTCATGAHFIILIRFPAIKVDETSLTKRKVKQGQDDGQRAG